MQTYSNRVPGGLEVQFSISDCDTGFILVYDPRKLRLRMFYFTHMAAAVKFINSL
jgi:hypothetical protein